MLKKGCKNKGVQKEKRSKRMGCREKETSREEGQKVPGCQKMPKDRTAKRKIRQRKAVLYKTSEFFDSAMTSEKLSGEKGVSGFGLRCQQEVGRIVKIQTCQGQTRSRESGIIRKGCQEKEMSKRRVPRADATAVTTRR